MLEVLFSIALLALIASTILPNVISLLKNQSYIGEREEIINLMSSRMEEIIGSAYNNEDLNFNFDSGDNHDDKFKIEIQNDSSDKLNHITLRGKRRGSDEEIKMEVYLKKGGLLTNWTCDVYGHAPNYWHGDYIDFGRISKGSYKNLWKWKYFNGPVLCHWVHKRWNYF